MLFSATMPAWVKSLTRKHLKTPVLVDLVGDAESGRINESIRCAPRGSRCVGGLGSTGHRVAVSHLRTAALHAAPGMSLRFGFGYPNPYSK